MQNNEAEYDRILNPPHHKPDWGTWKQAKTIKLWHAVALACDLDPHQFTLFDSPRLDRIFSRPPERFDNLLTLAKNSLGGGSILKPTQICPNDFEETEVAPSNFGAWVKSIRYSLPAEFPWQDEPVLPLSREWPWGTYETDLLRHLALAANRFWRNYDPTDASTAPTNKEVINWLVENGVANRTAEIIATILRADGLPTGPRK
jgi:hypothetical protein